MTTVYTLKVYLEADGEIINEQIEKIMQLEARLGEPENVKSLAQYLAKDIAYNIYGHDVYRWGTTKWCKMLEQALDAYQSTERVKIRIEQV